MRESVRTIALRSYNQSVRGVIMASDDSKLMQTVDVRCLNGEFILGIERPQVYGLNSVVAPPDDNGGKAAEVVIGFRGGNRAHPYVVSEGDRRSRPKNGEAGQSGLWHYRGATMTITTKGLAYDPGPDKKPFEITIGTAMFKIEDGKITAQIGGAGGPTLVLNKGGVYLGGDPDSAGAGSFLPVQLVGGPAKNVFGLQG